MTVIDTKTNEVAWTLFDEGIRPIIGYMVALFIGIIVIALVPSISIGFLKTP